MKMIQALNLRQKFLNQVFVIIHNAYILVTGDITAKNGDANTKDV